MLPCLTALQRAVSSQARESACNEPAAGRTLLLEDAAGSARQYTLEHARKLHTKFGAGMHISSQPAPVLKRFTRKCEPSAHWRQLAGLPKDLTCA